MSETNVLKIIVTGDGTSFTRTMTQVDRAIKKAQNSTRQFGHSTISNTQAASAAIRLMEGDITNLVRAAERFVGQSQVLSGVLKTAFPVIGAIAIAGVIGEGVKRVTDFIEKLKQVPYALHEGLRDAGESMRSVNDDLEITNDKLTDSIAKLQHKVPTNGIKEAIDEASKSADTLSDKLVEDIRKIGEVMKAQELGFTSELFGNAKTSDLKDRARALQTTLENIEDSGQAKLDANRTADISDAQRKKNADDIRHQMAMDSKKAIDIEADAIRRDLAFNQAQVNANVNRFGQHVGAAGTDARGYNRQPRITALTDYLHSLQQGSRYTTLADQNYGLEVDQKNAQDAKDAAEAQKAAAQKLVQAWTQQLDKIKSVHDLTNADEANFWAARALTVKKGSLAYTKAIDEANKAMAPAIKAQAEERDKWLANTTGVGSTFTNSVGQEQNGTAEFGGGSNDLSKNSEVTKGIADQSKATVDWLRNLNAGTDIQRQNADAFAEASLQIEVATGRMSQHDAAVVQAQLHTQEYTHALSELKDAQAAVAASGLSDAEKKARTSAIQNQIDALNGSRAIQVMQDANQIRATSNLGQFADGLAETTQKLSDWGAKAAQLFDVTLSRVNDEIIRDLTVPHNRSQWGNVGADFFRGVAGIGLEKSEGSVLKALGLDKFKKRQDVNAYIMNWPSGMGGGAISQSTGGLIGKVGGWLSHLFSGKSSGTGGIDLAGMASTLPKFPGFASGGDTPTDTPFWVGESGPELMTLGTPAHVTPNRDAVKSGDTHFHIDARGATDPAATKAMVHQAIIEAAPHIMTATAARQKDDRRRSPLSRR